MLFALFPCEDCVILVDSSKQSASSIVSDICFTTTLQSNFVKTKRRERVSIISRRKEEAKSSQKKLLLHIVFLKLLENLSFDFQQSSLLREFFSVEPKENRSIIPEIYSRKVE